MSTQPGLARRLGTADAVTIGLGSMVGAGVFAAFAPAATDPSASPMSREVKPPLDPRSRSMREAGTNTFSRPTRPKTDRNVTATPPNDFALFFTAARAFSRLFAYVKA